MPTPTVAVVCVTELQQHHSKEFGDCDNDKILHIVGFFMLMTNNLQMVCVAL